MIVAKICISSTPHPTFSDYKHPMIGKMAIFMFTPLMVMHPHPACQMRA
jgi:hypothetical protein